MRRRAIIGALLLIVLGVALGATVFRTDIAQATGLAQAVTVDNTAANPVPVTGTVDVRSLPDRIFVNTIPAEASFSRQFDINLSAGDSREIFFDRDVLVSTLTFPGGKDDEVAVYFYFRTISKLAVSDNESPPQFISLPQSVRVDELQVLCDNEVLPCRLTINVVGNVVF